MVETMEELPMTEYERRRLENIKRNGDMLSSLNINSILSNLTDSSLKRRRGRPPGSREWQKRIYERSRSSLRTQGIPASHPSGLSYDKPCDLTTPLSNKEPITMRNVYKDDEESHYSFVKRLRALEMNPVTNVGRVAVQEPVKPESFKLESENVARIVPEEGLTVIRFLPTSDTTVVVGGSRFGSLGVWAATSRDANDIGKTVHLYRPHSSTIYGIYVHPFSPTKIYSCCGDGLLRVMDIGTEEFDLLYSTSSGSAIYSLSQPPDDVNSMYIGERRDLKLYDRRAGKIVNSWLLHKGRINSIDFNPSNTNVLATTSTDGLACLWDLRKINNQKSKCKPFLTFTREKSIHSAYFSPSGSCLAITSSDHMIAVLGGADFDDNNIIYRGHSRNFPLCSRAIWGWDDTYLYMGCKKRRVEVLSVPQGKTTATLESSLVSSLPFQFDAHPCKVGMLVGASSGGMAFLWTSRDC